MTKSEFSRKFAETYGYTYKSSEQFIKELFEFLGQTIFKDGEDLKLQGFGTFHHRTVRAKRLRHPATGEMMVQPKRIVVRFTPSELLEPRK